MKYEMCRLQCVLALVALHVGLAHSWDFAVAERDLLKFYTINGRQWHHVSVRFDSQNFGHLAYDDVHNMILYVDKQSDNDAICSYNLNSMEYKYLTERNGKNIHSLAYDPVTETVFFTDTNERSINWFSLEPDYKNNIYGNLLIKMDEGIPTEIAVDSCRGYIYWMNTNLTQPSIERARFNGTDREVVIDTVLLSINTTYKSEPHSLIIDQNTQKMFWYEPSSLLKYPIYSADLDGGNKTEMSNFRFTADVSPSNTLTVSENGLISLGWFSNSVVWEEPKIKTDNYKIKMLFLLQNESPVTIVANYKIIDQIQGLKNCEALKDLVQNNSVINDSYKIATEYDGPFCVHGMSVNGQSVCKCTPGYTGKRCDISVCDNYCLQGDCSINDEELPECRCNAGYSGERCEVYVCQEYCLNNGACSLYEDSKPSCHCIGDYVGERCEVTVCLNYCLQGNCSISEEGLPKCRCNAGYFGKRCELDVCYRYCSNNGICSLNKESEPVCQCVGDYEGSRCETVKHGIANFFKTTTQYTRERDVEQILSKACKRQKFLGIVASMK